MPAKESKRTWLVTGCSAGFGREFVTAIVARGDQVIATARNLASLDQFSGQDSVKQLQLDVTASQAELDEKIEEAIAFFGKIDVLVNNAGFVGSGVWEEVSQEQVLSQFATNVFGAMNITRGVLPHFRARGSGTTVFMSSISAWHGVGAGGLYSSSKFALEGAAECLQKETAHLGLETFIIVLGQFRTGILDPKRRTGRSANSISAYDTVAEELSNRHAETDGKQPGNPKLAVEAILDVVRREGMMEGRKSLPLRIALGSDAVSVVRGKCEETLNDLARYEDFSKSTDFTDAPAVPSYR